MSESRRAVVTWPLVAALAFAGACVPPATPAVAPPRSATDAVRDLPARPPLAVVVRDGDPRAALAVTVLTAGVDDAAGARVPVALAGVVEARLAASGATEVSVEPTWDGYRIRALLPPNGDATTIARALRDALLTPIGATDLASANKKLAALADRPIHDGGLADVVRCTDGPVAEGRDASPATVASLEHWRAASHGLGRIVFGAVGAGPEVDAIASVLLAEPAWPTAQAPRAHVERSASPPLVVYDAGHDVGPSAARVTLALRTPSASSATEATALLAGRASPLSTRLHALDGLITLREVTATAQARGGCIAVVVDVARAERRHDVDEESILAAAVGVVRQEARLALARASKHVPLRRAALLGDPREAAEDAAWWALVDEGRSAETTPVRESTAIGLGAAEGATDFAARVKAVTESIERDDAARKARVVDARSALEQGQGAVWFLLGSPCGTFDEADADAGLTALAIAAVAEQAKVAAHGDLDVSEWITSQGLGLVARATPHAGDSSAAFVARTADAVGAAFMAAIIDESAIARARAGLMTTLAESDARSFATLADILTPGHPSWSFPLGTGRGLEGWPDGAVRARIAALRHGPLRLAIVGNEDAAQIAIATEAVDRWVPHVPGVSRTCPPHASLVTPKPGTYVAPAATTTAAWLALPVPSGDHDAAVTLAAALDGSDGLLAHALSSGLASTWSARVVGPVDACTVVIHVSAPAHALDAAVAQVRGLLDRLRQGAFTEEDRARAAAAIARADLAASLDPRQRLISLWRGSPAASASPSLDALHTFLAQALHDESLVIVAARPPKAAP